MDREYYWPYIVKEFEVHKGNYIATTVGIKLYIMKYNICLTEIYGK